jgi:winged helix DNA-binding protein
MPAIERWSTKEVTRHRLAIQRLTTSGFATAAEVVRTLGAVQAQDYAGAKWALAMRAQGLRDADVEREIAGGRILRTHVLRPTWHFVSPADIRWMLSLTAPRVSAAMAYYNRTLELTPAVFRRSRTAIAKALAGGKHLTRSELGAVLGRARIGATSGQRLGHLMMQAELDAVVCSGARRGKQFTYALLDECVPATPPMERDAALLELTRRYFATRGPATAHDFAWWSGLTISDAKRGIEMAGAELEKTSLGEQPAWLSVSRSTVQPSKGAAHLLPNYDEYFIGYKDRGAIAERVGSSNVDGRAGGFLAHFAFVDGQLVGSWGRAIEKDRVIVEVVPRTALGAAEQGRIEAQARRFGEFLGLEAETRFAGARRLGSRRAGG